MFINPTEVRRLLDNLEDGRAEYDESDAISDLNDAAEPMAEKITWLYSREPEVPSYGIHAVTLKRESGEDADVVFAVKGGLVAVNTSPTQYRTLDEAEELARAILRVVKEEREKEVE